MERVAFLIEATNQVLRCLLNPETLLMQRTTGIRPQHTASGQLTGRGLADDPVLYTGGGRTILELDLLFDLSLSAADGRVDDVRAITLPLWQMAENSAHGAAPGQPPQLRFIWGKAWNIPAVVLSVAERYERFTARGQAQRSWMRLRLLRINAVVPQPAPRRSFVRADVPAAAVLATPDETWGTHEWIDGERLDQLAHRYYGDTALWRLIAVANDLADPADSGGGRLLHLPPRPNEGRLR